MRFFKYTNTGPRRTNEDSLYVSSTGKDLSACIADGVGGVKYGEIASDFVTKKFINYVDTNRDLKLSEFLIQTNNQLIEYAQKELQVETIATTFSAVIISLNVIKGIHIGDSRVCLLRKNGIKQLTIEHNELGRLIREGKISADEKKTYPGRNVIEHIMGKKELFSYQEFEMELEPEDRIILSTDGFHETLSKIEIRDISVRYKSLEEFNRHLIIEIENRVLRDNASFICIEI